MQYKIKGISTEVATLNLDGEIQDLSIEGYNVEILIGNLYTTIFISAYDDKSLMEIKDIKAEVEKCLQELVKQ